MKADAAVQAAQDEVALLTARFDVRRGELDAAGNEFIAAIEAQKNVLSLEEARRRLAQLEEDVKSRAATNKASLAVVAGEAEQGAARDAARAAGDRQPGAAGRRSTASSRSRRTATRPAACSSGMALPEYREGDTVWPGRPVADVIESGRMEVRAKVDENDRANLTRGPARDGRTSTRCRARRSPAKVGALAGLANRATSSRPSATRQFDVTFQFDKPEPQAEGRRRRRAWSIEGKDARRTRCTCRGRRCSRRTARTTSSCSVGDRFEQREVKVVQRTESRVVRRRPRPKGPRSRWSIPTCARRGADVAVRAAGPRRRRPTR